MTKVIYVQVAKPKKKKKPKIYTRSDGSKFKIVQSTEFMEKRRKENLRAKRQKALLIKPRLKTAKKKFIKFSQNKKAGKKWKDKFKSFSSGF